MFRPERLAGSTSFRLALAFAALFVLAFILSGAVVYRTMSHSIADRLDDNVRNTFAALAATYGTNDLEDLVSSVDSYAALSREQAQAFGLFDKAGGHLAGNIQTGGPQAGFATRSSADLGLKGDDDYRVLTGDVDGNVLVVASSVDESESLKEIVLTGFGWATFIAAIIAVAGGALLAARLQRRLDAIGSTMDAVSHGELAARIPLMGSGDDIDTVSSQVNAALGRLAGLVEGMRQVSADIAHDLKTPLNRLHIILENMSAKVKGAETESDLAEAQAEIEHINATFDALLRIAQIEAGARKARFTQVDLNELIGNIAEVYEGVAADEDRSLTVALGKRPAMISGDADLLTQLFANLVENALRHGPPGTAVSININTAPNGKPEVEVRDTGPGIPASERDNVFRRLYRMDKSRKTPGSGLGLSLVKAIADLHDATVTLDDAKPGLRAQVRFP